MAGLGRSGPVRGSAGGEVLVIVSPHFAPGSTPLRGFLCFAPDFMVTGARAGIMAVAYQPDTADVVQ
jgi:hypothetical protein